MGNNSRRFDNMNLALLPDDCFAHIISFTSPRDACRSSMASRALQPAADSDGVWDKFLPPNYGDILSRLDRPLAFSSKKDMFMKMCNPLLIDEGRKTFVLEKTSGKICYILSARELHIPWASHPLYWSWKPLHQSRFAEAAELRTIWWLEIQGRIKAKTLSPNTHYAAYLIVKFADRAYGLDSLPSEVSLEVGGFRSQGIVYLRNHERQKECIDRVCFANRSEMPRSRVVEGKEVFTREREDGWIEIELGEFYNKGGEDEVKMCLKEIKGEHLKAGLIVEGIELRPKVCK